MSEMAGELNHDNPPLPPLGVDRGPLEVRQRLLTVTTHQAPQLIDLTDDVLAFCAEGAPLSGQLTVHSTHTTAAVVLNEMEPLLAEDAMALLARLVPPAAYRHDDFARRQVNLDSPPRENAQAHLQHLLLGHGCSLPVAAGRPTLGRWQRVLLVELDTPGDRQLVLQLLGVASDKP